ncbi:Integral membrane protein of the Golgi [Fusarium chlamydosporum]
MPRRRKPPRAGALAELPPLRIASQIATLQAIYYFAALVLIVFTALVSGSGFSWTLVFGWEGVRGDTTHGWLMSFIFLLDGGLIISIAIVALIARSKLVPDFAVTVHFLHLVIASLYSGRIPRHGGWWLTMIASCAISVSVGIWGCQYRELQPLFFGGRPILPATGAAASSDSTATQPTTADEEMAIPIRGRGRDGAGEYEMAAMQPTKSA